MKENRQSPEIRMEGFEDDWIYNNLRKLAIFNPKTEPPEEFEYVDLESVVGTEMMYHRKEKRDTAPSRAQRVAQYGDLFYQTVRPYQKNNYLFEKEECYLMLVPLTTLRSYQRNSLRNESLPRRSINLTPIFRQLRYRASTGNSECILLKTERISRCYSMK